LFWNRRTGKYNLAGAILVNTNNKYTYSSNRKTLSITTKCKQEHQIHKNMISNTFNPVYIGDNRVLIKTKRDIFLRVDSNDALVSQSLITKGEWDPVLEKLYDKILFPGANYMEIGCHIGYFSVLACCLVGIDGFCVLFEPNPRSMDLLKANLRANILTHICDINELAISDMEGEVEFIQFSINSGGSSLGMPGERLIRDYAEVPVIKKCNTTLILIQTITN
jgi:FkbM family methyltransferase